MQDAIEKMRLWKKDPVQYVRDNFQVEPDAWQADALMCAAQTGMRKQIAMKSATGVGKSTILAWLGWYRLTCYAEKGEHPKGAALSGEGRDNLRDNLWSELAKWRAKSEFLTSQFEWTKEQIFNKTYPQTWFLSARSYPKDADSEAVGRSLSGLHSKFPFVLLDEIGDMPSVVGQKAEQIFTGGVVDGLVAAAGNPTSTTGLLYTACTKLRAVWEIITITADPMDPKRSSRVDKEHAQKQIDIYGRDNPWVMATILGEFPPTGFNNLISLDAVEAAMKRKADVDKYEFSQKRLGIDVARFGGDLSCIFPRQGLMSFKPVVMRGATTDEIAARVMLAKEKWKSELELVDDTGGYGSGVIDFMAVSGHSPVAINFGGKAIDPRYKNRRAEMWLKMADWVKSGGCLPNVPELVAELTAPTYTFDGSGKFMLESKEQIKERLGSSPDRADALALTFALPDAPTETKYSALIKDTKLKADFDPLRDFN
jgi:hypothetical protein